MTFEFTEEMASWFSIFEHPDMPEEHGLAKEVIKAMLKYGARHNDTLPTDGELEIAFEQAKKLLKENGELVMGWDTLEVTTKVTCFRPESYQAPCKLTACAG